MSAADPFGLVGQVLDGQFRVDKLVGEGGFSAVYRGHHQGLNEPIAVKCLKLPAALGTSLVDSFVQRFRDESRILYRLSQGNLHIVRSIAAGTTQAPATGALVPYMVLEWLEGRTVQNDLTVRRTLGEQGRSLEEVVKLFDTAADGLAYAHAQGVAHRDLNPGNLFLASTKQGTKMKVLDFGVAKLMHEGALDLGPRAATVGQIKIFAPAYGAPEQFDDRIGAVGAASDVYAFALILLEALRDKNVVEAAHLGEFAQRTTDPQNRPTPRSLGIDVPDEVEQAFARATTLDPAQRWQSVGDFWQSLTIAQRFAIERKYEQAARETPPLAMAGSPPGGSSGKALGAAPGAARLAPKDAAIGGKNLARTMPLGTSTPGFPRPGAAGAIALPSASGAPGAVRVSRTPTTIGIPSPAGVRAGAPSAPHPGAAHLTAPAAPPRASRPPSSPRNPSMPSLPPIPGAPGLPRPATPALSRAAAGVSADRDGAATDRPEPVMGVRARNAPAVAAPYASDEEEEDEATRVHAPSNEVLRTLALHDAANARAAADAAIAAARGAGAELDEAAALEAAARDAAMHPPHGDLHARSSATTPGPNLGGTLMMSPAANMAAPFGAAYAQAQAAGQAAPAQESSPQGPLHAPEGLKGTLAMATPPLAPPGVGFAAPSPFHGSSMQGAPGASSMQPADPMFGSPSMQPPDAGFGAPSMQPSDPMLRAASMQPSDPMFGQSGAVGPSMQPHQGLPFPPPAFVQPNENPAAPAKPLPILPIAIGLAVLALGGIGLGVFALRARHAHSGTKTTDSAEVSSATPVPVPVQVDPEPPPVPAVAATEAVDAPDAAAAEVAAHEADASTTAEVAASATAAPSAPVAPAATTATAATATAVAPFTPPVVATATPAPAKSAVDPNAFNEGAARTRLAQANGVLAFCKKEGGVTGPGHAVVTFAPDGTVASVVVEPPYAGTKEGDCVSSQFRRAKVTSFTGAPQPLRHAFEVPK